MKLNSLEMICISCHSVFMNKKGDYACPKCGSHENLTLSTLFRDMEIRCILETYFEKLVSEADFVAYMASISDTEPATTCLPATASSLTTNRRAGVKLL